MAARIFSVDYYYTTVENRPGQGCKFLSTLAEAEVNLLAFNAFPVSSDRTQLVIYPQNATWLREDLGEIAGLHRCPITSAASSTTQWSAHEWRSLHERPGVSLRALAVVDGYPDFAVLEPERVAKRDQLMGTFGGHHACNDRGLKYRSLRRIDITVRQRIPDRFRKIDYGLRPRRPLACGLCTDIHHARLVAVVDMGKHSASDVVHLHLAPARDFGGNALLAVAIVALSPSARQYFGQLVVAGAVAKWCAHVETLGGKQAGIQFALG